MTAIALATQITPRNRASKSPLFRRLFEAASDDARDAAHDFCLDVIAATIYAPKSVQRLGGTAFLLFLDALNDKRTGRSRELRWRRFVRVLAPLAERTQSQALVTMLRENADLL